MKISETMFNARHFIQRIILINVIDEEYYIARNVIYFYFDNKAINLIITAETMTIEE